MLLLFVGRIVQVVLNVLLIKLATTLLDPAEYGTWVLVQTAAGLLILFGISPFGLYLNRHVSEWNGKGLLPQIFKKYSLYMLTYSLLMMSMSWGMIKLGWLNFPGVQTLTAILLISLLMVTQTFHQTWVPSLNFLGNRKAYVLGSCLAVLLTIITAYGLHHFGLTGIIYWGFSIAIGFTMSTLLFVPKTWILGHGLGSLKEHIKLKDMVQFVGPLFLITAFTWAQSQGYRLLLEQRMGVSELGKFAAGYGIILGLYGALESVLASFYQADFFQKIGHLGENQFDKALSEVWKASLYPYILAGVFLYVLGPEIARLFLGEDFSADMGWLGLVAIAEGGRLIFNLLCVGPHGKKQTGKLVLPQLSAVLLTFGLLITSDEATYDKIVVALGAGYALSICILIMTDFKTYHESGFFGSFMIDVLPGAAYLLIGLFLRSHLAGPLMVIAISAIGGAFMVPFFLRYLRDRNEKGFH
jgi:O-antigen/teichoic acid export membrane protein